ncbi:dihydrofolate reductase family protein [Nocardioides zeae]|uniref:Dihydrofolate reductase family protein n=1 Tax=Nocardioides imazamoxiresistens TaxID=3231893 RepID=A0ABU3Q1M2_9ACTN|nr:dihydrofolate reductase family protein [Nocardioides zeae]MDT9595398.1 dihydrofolate reductase family protein [Nocardioides zeae]
MGKLVLVENLSLDGVMQAPGRPDEDTRGGFGQGGWAFAWLGEDPEAMEASMAGDAPGALLLGRRTYEDLVGFWLSPAAGDNPFADLLRHTPKHVVSGVSPALEHPASHLLHAPDEAALVEGVRTLVAATEGEVVVLGSGMLARALLAADLVDELVLTIIPVVLGSGARLFDGDGTRVRLAATSTYTSPRGAVVGHYVVQR